MTQFEGILKQPDGQRSCIERVIACGYACYDGIAKDANHRYLSWEHCHRVFLRRRENPQNISVDQLCLHLAWYLASWGMMRNSFLIQKDYKIHAKAIQLLFDPQWNDLWDISADKLAQTVYAKEIIRLGKEIARVYIEEAGAEPTATLITKILLGTIGCVPAYDRYFKKGLSLTGDAVQSYGLKSLTALGKTYIRNMESFERLRKHCSGRIEYPAAKVMDMCFFEFGLQGETNKA